MPSLALLALLVLATRRAPAEERVPIRATYSAPSACPCSEELVRQVLARSDRLRVAHGDELARELVFEISSVEDGYRGTFALSVGAGTTDRRAVAAEDCAEVVRALGLIAALAIDPQARLEFEPRNAEASADAPAPVTPPPASPAAPPPVAAAVPGPAPRRNTPSQSLSGAVGLRLEMATGLGSILVLVPRAVSDITLPREVRLALSVGGTRSVVQRDRVSTALTLATARLELCVPAVQRAMVLAPCGGLDIGRLWARPSQDSELDQMEEDSRLWLAPLVGLRLAWSPAREPTGTRLEAETILAAIWPTIRGDYYFRSNEEMVRVHEVPVVAGFLGVGLGLRFGDR